MFSGRAQRCTVAACAPQPLLTLVQVDTHAPHKLVPFCAQYGHSLLVAASRSCVGCRSLLVLQPCMKRRVRVRQLACLGAASAVRLFVLPSGCLRPPTPVEQELHAAEWQVQSRCFRAPAWEVMLWEHLELSSPQ